MVSPHIRGAMMGHVLDSAFVLPRIPELHVEQRKDMFLLISPLGPRFCVATKAVALFVELCDGRMSIADVIGFLKNRLPNINPQELHSSVESLYEARFFEQYPVLPIGPLRNFEMNITSRCNLCCPFCYYDADAATSQASEEELGAPKLVEVAREALDINKDAKIVLTGGEPLVREDLREITEGIAAEGADFIEILTNGTLFTKSTVDWMAAIPCLRVQMSIDSLVPEENALTRGEGSLERCLRSMDWLNAAGVPLTVASTLTKVNFQNAWRLRQYCNARNVDFRHTLFFTVGQRSRGNESTLRLSDEELWEVYDSALRNVGIDILQKESLDQILVEYPRTSCGMGYGTVALHPDGTLSPCTHFKNPEMALGNVLETSLESLIEKGGRLYCNVTVDNMESTAPCKECPVRYWCAGGCKAQSYNTYGTMRVPPRTCSSLKRILTESMWAYCLDADYLNYTRDDPVAGDATRRLRSSTPEAIPMKRLPTPGESNASRRYDRGTRFEEERR